MRKELHIIYHIDQLLRSTKKILKLALYSMLVVKVERPSLNDILESGLSVIPLLTDVLLRFCSFSMYWLQILRRHFIKLVETRITEI